MLRGCTEASHRVKSLEKGKCLNYQNSEVFSEKEEKTKPGWMGEILNKEEYNAK